MTRRPEKQEDLRRERIEAERRAEAAGRRRIVIGYVVAGALALALVAALIAALAGPGSDPESGAGTQAESDNVDMRFGGEVPAGVRIDTREGTPPEPVTEDGLTAAADVAGCDLRLDLDDEGNAHLDPGDDELPDYATNPPASGDHYPVPLADGAFLDKPSPGAYIHSLEHGRVAIQYSPDLSEEDQLALKGVFDADRPGVDLFPDPDMPDEVAVTAWTQLMSCETYEGATTLDAIRAFRDAYLGHGPEAVPF